MAKRYLLTQTDPVYRHYQSRFASQGINCEWLPLLQIVRRPSVVSALDFALYDKVIVLSQHAVYCAAHALKVGQDLQYFLRSVLQRLGR